MKLEWQDAPTRTQWGHDMVVTTVALGKDHSVDLYCARSKTAEAEVLLKKPWVGLTDEEFKKMVDDAGFTRTDLLMIGDCVEQLADLVEAKLKEKNT